MELGITIFILMMCALLLYFARHHFGEIFKVLATIFLITMVASVIFAFLIVKDVADLKDDMLNKKNLFVIQDENKTYSAIEIKLSESENVGLDNINYYNKTRLLELEKRIKEEKFDKEIGRVFVMTPEMLDNEFELKIGLTLNQKDMIKIIKSDYPYDTLAQIITTQKNLTGMGLEFALKDLKGLLGPDEKVKSYFSAALIFNYFSGGKSMIKDIKTGTLQVLPQTISFKLIKYLPIPTWLITEETIKN